MFILAINYKNINNIKRLFLKIFSRLIPLFNYYIEFYNMINFEITSFISCNFTTVNSAYRDLYRDQYFEYANMRNRMYNQQVLEGRDYHADFQNAIRKIRHERWAGNELTFDDVNSIKLMGEKYGYNRETRQIIRGLSNNQSFALRNGLVFS